MPVGLLESKGIAQDLNISKEEKSLPTLHLLNLSEELIAQILSYISWQDRATPHLALSCKRIYQIQCCLPKIALIRSFCFSLLPPSQLFSEYTTFLHMHENQKIRKLVPYKKRTMVDLSFLKQVHASKDLNFYYTCIDHRYNFSRKLCKTYEDAQVLAYSVKDGMIKEDLEQALFVYDVLAEKKQLQDRTISSWYFLSHIQVKFLRDKFMQYEEDLESFQDLITSILKQTNYAEWLLVILNYTENSKNPIIFKTLSRSLPDELKSNKEFIRKAAKISCHITAWVSVDELVDDKKMCVAIVRRDPNCEKIPEDMWDKKQVVLSACKGMKGDSKWLDSPMEYASERLRKKKEFVLKIVKRYGIEHFTSELRNDKEAIETLIQTHPSRVNTKHASEELKQDKEFIKHLCSIFNRNRRERKFFNEVVHANLLADLSFALEIQAIHPGFLIYFSDNIQQLLKTEEGKI